MLYCIVLSSKRLIMKDEMLAAVAKRRELMSEAKPVTF
jgi:hypothetical protein